MTAGPSGSAGSLAKNAVSQIGGRLLLSLGRLGAALMIVRLLGPERFGEYALVLNFVVLFEWLADFGQTDIAVRDICQAPGRAGVTLGALGWLKAGHGLLLCLLLPAVLAAMAYPAPIVRAGAVGGLSVLFYAGVQVFRTRFKVAMRMERDVGAEVGSLVVMLPLTWWACRAGAGVDVLVGCYAASRLGFFGLMLALAQGPRAVPGRRASRADVLALLREAAPLGVAGLLVTSYDSLATVMLSKLAGLHEVAQYAAATRFVFPVIIIVQSLSSAFYPPLSAQWRASPAGFAALQQAALDVSVLVGGGLFCGVFGGAGFLMGIMGPEIGQAAPVLRLMAVVVLARAVTTAMSPLIVVAGRQGTALWLTAASIVLQTGALLLLVPPYGITGAVVGYLAIELLLGVVPVSLFGQHVAGVRLRWAVPVRLTGCALAAVASCSALPTHGTLAGGVLSGLLYLALAAGTGTVSVRKAGALVGELAAARRAGAAA